MGLFRKLLGIKPKCEHDWIVTAVHSVEYLRGNPTHTLIYVVCKKCLHEEGREFVGDINWGKARILFKEGKNNE